MDEIYDDYRKFASIGLNHDQIKDCMVVVRGYTYREIEDARAMVDKDKNYWVDDSLDARAKKACDNFPEGKSAKDWTGWVDKYCGSKSINSATAQDWDAVRPDMVNSPPHYTAGGIETIDFIQAKLSPEGYRGYLQGNLLKYASRIGKKGSDDAGKAAWYAQRLEML